MNASYIIKQSQISTLEVALLCKRGLEAAGYTVALEGYENTNKITSSFEWEIEEDSEYVEKGEK